MFVYPGLSLRSNPGLKLVNAFGVLAYAFGVFGYAFGVFGYAFDVFGYAFGVFGYAFGVLAALGVFVNAFGVINQELSHSDGCCFLPVLLGRKQLFNNTSGKLSESLVPQFRYRRAIIA